MKQIYKQNKNEHKRQTNINQTQNTYRISANSFRGNYSFLEVGVRQLFKGGNYSKEETIYFLHFIGQKYSRDSRAET